MKNQILLWSLTMLFVISAGAQDKAFKRMFLEAEYRQLTEDYVGAMQNYEDLMSVDPANSNLYYLSALCRMEIGGKNDKVISLLEKAVGSIAEKYKEGSYKERNAPPVALFLLAKAYHIDCRFDEAVQTYSEYLQWIDEKDFAESEYVNANIQACETGKRMISQPVDVDFFAMDEPFRFDWDVFNPLISGNDSLMVFVTERSNRFSILVSQREGNGWSKPLGINPQIGLTGFVQPVSLSYDGKELYFVHNDMFNTDLYVSNYNNGRWSLAERLGGDINTKYTESHAAISQDGQALYFTSNRKGGIGGMDIYVSRRLEGNVWGPAKNMGHMVNTYYNEETPFLANNDRRLFFSSQGHNTMGGFDIFYANQSPDGTWDLPQNMGYPINTTNDDLFFNPGWNLMNAYYSRRAEEGDRNKIIYMVEVPPLSAISEVTSPESKTGDSFFAIAASGQETTETGNPFASLGIYYILNNILFDYNESVINKDSERDVERISMLMMKFPEIGVELIGHADAKGSEAYNMKLSNKRAQSVADYLIREGIDPGRIKVHSVGESEPVAINKYADGRDAPEGRKLNRHVSIQINNLSNDKVRVADIFVPDKLIPQEDKGYTVLLFQSSGRVANTPEIFLEEEVSMISTDQSYMYTAGQFEMKADAIAYLNEAIDQGYPDATLLERRGLEKMIRGNSLPGSFDREGYTIQFIALQKSRDISYFGELNSVRRINCKDGLHRYVTGNYTHIEDAVNDLKMVKAKGYRNAMIMPNSRYESMIADL